MEDFNSWSEVIEHLQATSSQKIYNISFNGSGDSFENFYGCDLEDEDFSRSEHLIWELIEETDANFNDEGCEGSITIDVENRKVIIDIQHYVQNTEQGDTIEITNL